jgi:hypothetical protein
VAKAGLLSSVVDIKELGERDSFLSLDFMLGVAVTSSQRETQRESWFKGLRQKKCGDFDKVNTYVSHPARAS